MATDHAPNGDHQKHGRGPAHPAGSARSRSAAPDDGGSSLPDDDPEARLYTSEPLEDENGDTYVIQQQNVGAERVVGGGEWPDPKTPPRLPAPGAGQQPGTRT